MQKKRREEMKREEKKEGIKREEKKEMKKENVYISNISHFI